MTESESTRRRFLGQTLALTATALGSRAAGAAVPVVPTRASNAADRASAHGDGPIRVALVGCGGRGTGAALQALQTEGPVELVAMADAFEDRLGKSYEQLAKRAPERVAVPAENKYVGFDAFRRAIDSGAEVVILATPPGFRPEHFEYAIERGRHVFMEKPVAVDAPGVRRVLEAAEAARQKNLKVGVGLQRHHDPAYLETVRRIHDGAIGDVVLMRVYWNSAGVWVRARQAGQSEMEYQMRNWYYFNWLCGDHIVEQHIHNIDVGNWVKGTHPVTAQGQGGRQWRTGKDHGEIFDHHFVEFTYADGATMLSQCRHIENCWDSVAEHAHGTRGTSDVSGGVIRGGGGWDWRYDGETPDPYQVEHDRFFAAVRKDEPHNEAETGATATMTAILGRMATYSGKRITWDEALASDLSLAPASYAWNADPSTLPDKDGRYPVPMPGVTRAV